MPIPIAYKTRSAYAVVIVSFVALPVLIGYLGSETAWGPFRWAILIPSIVGLLLPLAWPTCPHCKSGIIWPRRDWRFHRSRAARLRAMPAWFFPPRYCPTCHQELDGPLRTKDEFRAHVREERRRLLAEPDPPEVLRELEAIIRRDNHLDDGTA